MLVLQFCIIKLNELGRFMSGDDTQIMVKDIAVDNSIQENSYWHNLSGRFWIAFCAMQWLGLSTTLIFLGLVKLESNSMIAIYTAFSTGAFGIVMTYVGQNAQNKIAK